MISYKSLVEISPDLKQSKDRRSK